MISNIKNFVLNYGILRTVRLMIYPLILFMWGPIRLIITLWNARILANGRWSNYLSFGVQSSINQLFYKTQVINIDRFGRNGVSPYLSLGNYNLGYWWHLSSLGSYLYCAIGVMFPIICAIGWIITNSLWAINSEVTSIWLFAVLYVGLISSTFYANAFIVQNYNMFGWMIFPAALWSTLSEYFYLSIFIWLLASFGSITTIFVGTIICFLLSLINWDITILLIIVPAIIKVLSHLYWTTSKGDPCQQPPGLKKSILRVIKSIGISRIGARYKRTTQKKISKSVAYFGCIYAQYYVILVYFECELKALWLICCFIFFMNSFLMRFADNESITMVMFSVSTLITINEVNIILLLSYWIVISPLPRLLNDSVIDAPLDILPPLMPFNLAPLVDAVEEFLSPVQKDMNVLFAFEDPEGEYEKVFDGYRNLLEIPLYVASRREFLLLPSWWAVFENNYEGALDFWGRDTKNIIENITKFDISFVIAYTCDGVDLDDQFFELGFEVISTLDWRNMSNSLNNETPWTNIGTPKWWLLKVPKNVAI